MNMPKYYGDDFTRIQRQIENTVSSLDRLAQALHYSGIGKSADCIYKNTQILSVLAEEIRKISSEIVWEQVQSADQSTTNMVSAALAVASKLSDTP